MGPTLPACLVLLECYGPAALCFLECCGPLDPLHAAILELPALAGETPHRLAEHFLRQLVAIPLGTVSAVKYCQDRLNQGQWAACSEDVRDGVVAALADKLRIPAATVAARGAAREHGDVV